MSDSGKKETEALIQAAVEAACEACMAGIDEKIKAAVEMGATVGAAAGAKIGAEAGAEAAIRALERERKRGRKQQHDRRLHNTRLLLRNYRTLNEHYHNAIYDTATAEDNSEDFADIMMEMNSTMSDEALYIESIKQSCVRTKVIMAHVNNMLEVYEIMCDRSKRDSDKRHWRVLDAMYLSDDPETAGQIAKRENIDKRTVYKDIDTCVEDLTTLFFGIDGIEKG